MYVMTLFSSDWQRSCKRERKYRSPGVEEENTTASGMRGQRGKIEASEGGERGKYTMPPDRIPGCSSCGTFLWKAEMRTAETTGHWF